MILGDPNYPCSLTCNGTATKCSNKKLMIKIIFKPHSGNKIKKVNQNFYVRSRVKRYEDFRQNKLLMSSFTKSQFNFAHCPGCFAREPSTIS